MTDVHANVIDLRGYKTWHSRGLINDLPMLSIQYILLQSAELIADNQLQSIDWTCKDFKHKVDNVNKLTQNAHTKLAIN